HRPVRSSHDSYFTVGMDTEECGYLTQCQGYGDLVVKSRLQIQGVPGSKPDSTEDPPVTWACCALNHT
ncbi:hypothetical protein AVEN_57837-1, partial [Araneus ventricosus]